jgi:magnesium-transporting ATPase (P-type)
MNFSLKMIIFSIKRISFIRHLFIFKKYIQFLNFSILKNSLKIFILTVVKFFLSKIIIFIPKWYQSSPPIVAKQTNLPTILDGPPAQSLGVEPVDADIIKQKQRNVKDPMISRQLIINILSSSAIMIVGTLGVFYKEVKSLKNHI